MKFTESQLEQAFISLLEARGYPHLYGEEINRGSEEVLIREDLQTFLQQTYADQQITPNEVFGIVRDLEKLPASDLYDLDKLENYARGFIVFL
jgi:type I restriction enzyme R subunit